MSSRSPARLVAALTFLLLAGCSSISNVSDLAYSSPGRFDGYLCPQLAARYKANETRAHELEVLMRKSEQGAGGGFVNAISYGPEYGVARGEQREIRAAAHRRNCDIPQSESEKSVH